MKKVFATMLAILMLISICQTSILAVGVDYNETTNSCDCYSIISKNDYTIAPGITESEVVLNFDDGSRRQVLHIMEADVNNEYV